MLLQQRLSPQPADKSQARIFMIMPVIFTYMLAGMPAGLVIYWTWSNLLGIGQQWFIMSGDAKKRGVVVDNGSTIKSLLTDVAKKVDETKRPR